MEDRIGLLQGTVESGEEVGRKVEAKRLVGEERQRCAETARSAIEKRMFEYGPVETSDCREVPFEQARFLALEAVRETPRWWRRDVSEGVANELANVVECQHGEAV